jgi:hypothetical protein
MLTTRRVIALSLCCCALLTAGPATGRAAPISGGAGVEGLGNFAGTFSYTPGGPGSATLVVRLENTSPLDNGGFLTAFLFNNPDGRVTGATLASSNAHFALLGGTGPDGGVNAAPFGHFDLGAGLGGAFLGGGSPRGGIPVGDSETFTFHLSGTGLDGLTEQSFFTSLSGAAGGGEPGQVSADGARAFFVARFRGFEDGGSDKVPATLEHAPEPGCLALAGVGVAGLLGCAWWRRRPGARRGRRVGPRPGAHGG